MREYKSGKYVCRPRADAKGVYYVMWREDGKPRRVSTGTTDPEGASLFLDQFVEGMGAETEGRFTVADCLRVHEDHVEKRGNIESAQRLRVQNVTAKNLFQNVFPEDLSLQNIRELEESLAQCGYAESTIYIIKSSLNSAINYAHNKYSDLCKKKSTIKINGDKPVVRRRERWLTLDEIHALLEASKGNRIYNYRKIKGEFVELSRPKPYPSWVPIFIRLLITTAGRITAVTQLTWNRVEGDYIDLHDPNLRGKRKGRAKIRIDDDVREFLEEARQNSVGKKYVIEDKKGNAVTSQRARQLFRVLCYEVGINNGSEDALWKVVPHSMRHTMATHLLKNDAGMYEVSKRLGHKDIKVTQDTYAHHDPKFQTKSAQITSNILKDIS